MHEVTMALQLVLGQIYLQIIIFSGIKLMLISDNKSNVIAKDKTGYSVLMSVYYKETAEHLRAAMDSIWNQTVKTDDFVLVCDGPLNQGLDEVVDEMAEEHPELNVIRLEKNSGLGNALNIGIRFCRNELVARMDSDDLSRPDRCERQLEVFCIDPDISICSGTVEEFTASVDEVETIRSLPKSHEEIIAFARKRNPFNHPCVMYKKEAVEASGGYCDFYLLEDYYLWIRMLQNGAKGYNIPEPLLWMRAGSEMYKRRSGFKYAKSQKALFKYMKETGFISGWQYFKSVAVRSVSAVIPNGLRKIVYKKVLRNEKAVEQTD